MLENNFPEQKRIITEEIEVYCNTSKRIDDKVQLKCLKEIKNLTVKNLKDLSPIRFHTWGEAQTQEEKGRRSDILGLWILNRIDEKHQPNGLEIYNELLNTPLTSLFKEAKVELLKKLIKLAKDFRREENENEPIEEEKMSLAEAVYRFYRYNPKNPNIYLESTAFQFFKLMRGLSLNEKEKTTLITAFCQSGKTFLVLPVKNIYLALGLTPVMVVLNRLQSALLKKRDREASKELYEHLKGLNLFSNKELNIFRETLYYDSKNKLEEGDNSLELALNGKRRRTIICSKHYQHIVRVNKYWTEESNICLLADEAQQSGAYKSKHSTYEDITKKYDSQFVILKKRAVKYIPITATAQDIVMVDTSLYTDNVLYIEPNEYYTGAENYIWKLMDISEDNEKAVIPDSLMRVLKELSEQEPIERYDRRWDKIDKHPIVAMLRTERLISVHNEVMNRFMKGKLPENIVNGNWAVITEHGDGIHLWHKSLEKKSALTINGIRSSKLVNGLHYFSSDDIDNMVDITDILQYLGKCGIERYPRVLLIAYDMCREAISFTSDYHKPENLHLSHGIFDFSDSAKAAVLMQAMQRLSGNHGDNIKPVVYCTQRTKERFIKAHTIHHYQIQKILALSQKKNTKITPELIMPTPEFLKELEIKKNWVPAGYNKITNVPMKTVVNKNAKEENAILKQDGISTIDFLAKVDRHGWKKAIQKMETIEEEANEKLGIEPEESEDESDDDVNESKSDDEENESKEEYTKKDIAKSREELGEEQFNKLISLFQRWSTGSTKIANFMHNLDGKVVYTREELDKICSVHGIRRYDIITASNNSHGKVMQKLSGERYRLQPCLFSTFSKYF